MSSKRTVVCFTLALFLAATIPALAEHHEGPSSAMAKNLAATADKVAQLADAIPEETWGWRPMEGVRSVSEAVMHVAGANYFFAMRLGTAPPEGLDMQNLEKITDKAECVEILKDSSAHMVKALDSVADPSAEMDLFGREGTAEEMMLIAVGHAHEHLGQLIAYARSNEIAPPWSRPASDG